MPSRHTYRLTWVSLTLYVGYLFMAAPANYSHCSLPWTRGILTTTPPDLERGIAPPGPPVPTQPRHGVSPPSHPPRPRAWGCSSRPLPLASGVGAWGISSRPPPLTSDAGYLLSAAPPTLDAGCLLSAVPAPWQSGTLGRGP